LSKADEDKFQQWFENKWIPALKPELHNSAKALLNDDTARTELMGGFLRQEDYTQKTQALANQQKQWQAWYENANAQFAESVAAKEAMAAEAAQLEAIRAQLLGKPEEPVEEPSAYAAKLQADLEALREHLIRVDNGSFHATTALANLGYKAAKEGYSFDANKIVEISKRNNVPLDRAFEEFTAPERAEREKASFEKMKVDMREEVRRELMSNRSTPDSMSSPEASPVLAALLNRSSSDAPVQPKSANEIANSALQDFMENYRS
jgi:hypothetical protein